MEDTSSVTDRQLLDEAVWNYVEHLREDDDEWNNSLADRLENMCFTIRSNA